MALRKDGYMNHSKTTITLYKKLNESEEEAFKEFLNSPNLMRRYQSEYTSELKKSVFPNSDVINVEFGLLNEEDER